MRARTAQAAFSIALLLGCVGSVSASRVKLDAFARRCGIEASTYSPRVFADLGDGKWKEYENAKKVPLGDPDWSETAFMERKPHRPILVTIQGSGQDFAEYTSYCFDPEGNLTSLEREFRTAWGWGFSDKRQYRDAHESMQAHFFDIKTGHEITRPRDADGIKDALRTRVLRKLSEVPFATLINQEKVR